MLVLVQLCPPSRWLAVTSTGVEISSSSEQYQYWPLLCEKMEEKNSGGRVDSLVEVEAGLNVRQKFEINRDKSSCPKTGPGNIGPG